MGWWHVGRAEMPWDGGTGDGMEASMGWWHTGRTEMPWDGG